MATEIGVITKTTDDLAMVRTQRTTACEGCSERHTCHSLGGSREAEFEAQNQAHAQVGDSVVIAFKTGQLLSLSFLLYMFPILALIAGALIGDHAASGYGVDPSLAAAGSGFFFFLAAFGLIKLLDRQAGRKGKYRPVIVRIKQRSQTGEADGAGCPPDR